MSMEMEQLNNLGYMLYGNTMFGSAAPNMFNNYAYAPSLYAATQPYYYNDSIFGPYLPQQTQQQAQAQGQVSQTEQAVAEGTQITQEKVDASREDLKILADYCKEPEMTFIDAAKGGVSFMAFENLQSIIHPKNAAKTFKPTEEIFKGIKDTKLWKENGRLMQEAYDATFKLNRDAKPKFKWISSWLRSPITAPEDKTLIENLNKEMQKALKNGKIEEVTKVAEKMKAARGMNGKIPQVIDKIRVALGGESRNFATATARLNSKVASGAVEKAVQSQCGSLLKLASKEAGGMAIFAVLPDIMEHKISTAFSKDKSTGFKQIGQTGLKAVGAGVGWAAGKAAGTAVGAKVGAMVGTAICPGVGTVVGTLVGLVGGCVGSWLGEKLAKGIVGEDVADKVKREKQITTADGATELIMQAAQNAQAGKAMDAKTTQAFNRVYSQLAVA